MNEYSILATESGRQCFVMFAESEEATKFLEQFDVLQFEARRREGKNSITMEANLLTRNRIIAHRAEVEKARKNAETERRISLFKFCPVCAKELEINTLSRLLTCDDHGQVITVDDRSSVVKIAFVLFRTV